MKRTKRIFISDIHIGTNEKWSWFKNKKHEARLISFFKWIIKQDDVKDLIFLGDTFDTWIHPYNKAPITIEDIFNTEANQNIFNTINLICDTEINVIFISGNHDQHVTEKDIKKKFPKMIFGNSKYTTRPIYAEHGSQNDLFNSSEISYNYPLGYFISRILTNKDGKTILPRKEIKAIVKELIEFIVMEENLSESFFDLIMTAAKVNNHNKIKIDNNRKITCGKVKEKYKDIYSICKNKYGYLKTFHMIFGNWKQEWFAEQIANKENYKVIILGHTHESEIDKDIWGVDHIYLNTGSWIENDKDRGIEDKCKNKCKNPTFVIVDKGDKLTAGIYKWENNNSIKIKEKTVS